MKNGIFITFEGVEGSGKTTQIKLLAEDFKKLGREVVLTREPGGTPISEKIRNILLDTAHGEMSPVTEMLLYAASRNQHISEVIAPALQAGKVVLCDRYADATTAYQGAARKIDSEVISAAHEIATGGLMPAITILLDCPEDMGLKRARDRNAGVDRLEREKLDFHKRVRDGYLAIAKREPERVIVIDGTQDVETIHKQVLLAIKKILN